MFDDQTIRRALAHLQKDPVLARVVARFPVPQPRSTGDFFTDLVETIIGQQLSNKVADVLLARFYILVQQPLQPDALLALPAESIRACGISYAKITAIHGAAQALVNNTLQPAEIPTMTDQEVVDHLIQLRGVGRWTAQMLLMFSLQRPDIFSSGDLGLRTAVSRLYEVERTDIARIEEVASQWSPYRSLASRYLWMSLENT